MRPASASARHCEQCSLEVHDLQGLTEAQARALLTERRQLCVRYRVDHAGHIRFADSRPLRAASVAAVLLSGCATTTATAPTGTPESLREIAFEEEEDAFEQQIDFIPRYRMGLVMVDEQWPGIPLRMMLPFDPIPLFPEQAAPVGAPPEPLTPP